ncbi:hypothetical protein DFH09DRAFT_1407086 [Mycena vulgaris]|nr:hypothetical protein DFH09DRAFT_1407086 [Mycena vulgaris]
MSDEELNLLNKSCHEIRAMQIVAGDLVPLRNGRKLKIPGMLDFAIFSSFLGPLISKKIPQNKVYGTIHGHILDACQGAPLEMLLAKKLWIFPMFGSDPPHWILGWLQPGSRQYHIFDSVPELQSFMWAEPFPLDLLELEDTVYATLGKMQIDWEPRRRVLHSPPELERQINSWARMRCTLPDEIPIVEGTQTVADMGESSSDHAPELSMYSLIPAAASTLTNRVNSVENLQLTSTPAPVASSSKRKMEENPPQAAPKAKKPRKNIKRSVSEREKCLKDNKWVTTVEPHRVECKGPGCSNWVQLDKTSKFKLENWGRHELKCRGIVGLTSVRTAVVQKSTKIVKGPGSIASFFGPGKGKTVETPEAEGSVDSGNESEAEHKSKTTVKYITRTVNVTPSISTFFAPGPIKSHPREPAPEPEPALRRSCRNLSGEEYNEYIERTETRTMGGISKKLRARIVRQIFMYKKLRALGAGGENVALRKQELKDYARWEVNYIKKTVRSTRCEGLTSNANRICDACDKLARDRSLRHAINRKNKESKLPVEEQHAILMARNKYSSKLYLDDEAHNLNDQPKDPLVFKAFKSLQKGASTECFVQLYEACLNGELKNYATFKQLCEVLADVLEREGTDKKYGIRYPADYLNFMILLRSYGGQSARQYGIIAGQYPCPFTRQLRALIAKSEDALQNPYLIFANMARVKRLVDSIKYTGPVAVAGDCTKVRKRLTYSTDFGWHILGSVLPFEQCVVENPEEIDAAIAKITMAKAEATQVRAILIKLLKMAAELTPCGNVRSGWRRIRTIGSNMLDKLVTDFPPLTYSYPLYGIYLRTPVFKTDPAVAGTDAPHGSKTGRNQPQHGTHTASLGKRKLVNNDLVRFQRTGRAGLLKSDVTNVDKQDDGPARCMRHHAALLARTVEDVDGMRIQEGFEGLFVYLFVFGVLSDAWLNRTMTVANRVLAALRSRFWLHFWRAHTVNMTAKYPDLYSPVRSFISPASFHIFNRLCDSLLLLVIIYSRCYPDLPFCPWLLGTEFVEHFFGLTRTMLPNFTQRMLLSGSFKEKRNRNAAIGYVLDFDASPSTAEDRKLAEARLSDSDISALVELAFEENPIKRTPLGAPMRTGKQPTHDDSNSDSDFDPDDEDPSELDEEDVPEPAGDEGESHAVVLAAHDTACYSTVCEDYDNARRAESDPVVFGPPPPPSSPSVPVATAPVEIPGPPRSELIGGDGKLSIAMMTFRIDSKYALSRISRGIGMDGDDDAEPEKMTPQEAAQRVRVAQDSNSEIQDSKPRKDCELRWKNIAITLQKLDNTNRGSCIEPPIGRPLHLDVERNPLLYWRCKSETSSARELDNNNSVFAHTGVGGSLDIRLGDDDWYGLEGGPYLRAHRSKRKSEGRRLEYRPRSPSNVDYACRFTLEYGDETRAPWRGRLKRSHRRSENGGGVTFFGGSRTLSHFGFSSPKTLGFEGKMRDFLEQPFGGASPGPQCRVLDK